MLNLKTGKHFTYAPTMTRGGFLKGILASGIAPSITLATIANAGSANASVGRGMMRMTGARNATMFGGGSSAKLPYVVNEGGAKIETDVAINNFAAWNSSSTPFIDLNAIFYGLYTIYNSGAYFQMHIDGSAGIVFKSGYGDGSSVELIAINDHKLRTYRIFKIYDGNFILEASTGESANATARNYIGYGTHNLKLMTGRMYFFGLKCYNTNTTNLVHDFVPDPVGGITDVITGITYTNTAGVGSIEYGEMVV